MKKAWSLQLSYKRDSSAGVFLWLLRNFLEHLFYRTPLYDCFCALWHLATGNSYHNVSETFAIGKLTVVSIILHRNVSSNFWEPQVELSKQLLHLKKPLTVKFLRLSVQFGSLNWFLIIPCFSNHSFKKRSANEIPYAYLTSHLTT